MDQVSKTTVARPQALDVLSLEMSSTLLCVTSLYVSLCFLVTAATTASAYKIRTSSTLKLTGNPLQIHVYGTDL